MDRAPCYNTLAANQHQRTIDADAARGERFGELQAELAHDMTKALAGLQNAVPGYMGGSRTAAPREVLRGTADAVYDTLDTQAVLGELMLVLKDSACPLVAKFRKAVIDRYVTDTAEGIAEARGLE